MATGFNRDEVDDLLIRCHRRCCICHRYCGAKIETDHIVARADGGDNSIENALPVCFDCHAEAHAYNPRHPKGRLFTPNELRGHKEQWLRICETHPEIFVEAARDIDVGPLQGLIDELDYNLAISAHVDFHTLGFQFRDTQMERAIREGVVQILNDDLTSKLASAYGAVSQANELSRAWINRPPPTGALNARTIESVRKAIPLIQKARDTLLQFVQSEPEE
jgi:HNH endonuclease